MSRIYWLSFTSAVAGLFVASNYARSQEVAATDTVQTVQTQNATFAAAPLAQASIGLLSGLDTVCNAGFALSDGAMLACMRNSFPRLNRDGSGFGNSALGAEFNTLLRQVAEGIRPVRD